MHLIIFGVSSLGLAHSIFFVASSMITFGRVVFDIEQVPPSWLSSHNCSVEAKASLVTTTTTFIESLTTNAVTQI